MIIQRFHPASSLAPTDLSSSNDDDPVGAHEDEQCLAGPLIRYL